LIVQATEELDHLKRLFGIWGHNGVYVSPAMQNTLKEICVREGLDAAIDHARWHLWQQLR
jgi:hypothetical protein